MARSRTPKDDDDRGYRALSEAGALDSRRDREDDDKTHRSAPAAFMRATTIDEDQPIKSPGFDIPLWSDAAMLPGTDLTNKTGWKLFRRGAPFGNRADGTVAYGQELEPLVEMLQQPGVSGRRIGKGSYNMFFECTAEATTLTTGFMGYKEDLQMGKRAQIFPLLRRAEEDEHDFEKKIGSLWHEVWMSLICAANGIAPVVFCTWLAPGNKLMMFIQRGLRDLTSYLSLYDFNDGLSLAPSLADIFQKASAMGLVMTDIKAENMLVMKGGLVRFIDFDPVFTLFVKAHTDCVELINAVLLCNGVHCWANDEAGKGLTKNIRERMMLQLLPEMQENPDKLCEVLLQLTGRDAKKFPRLETLFRADKTNYRAISQQVVFMAGHYGGWAVGMDYDCGEGFNPNEPAIEQLARRIEDALGDEDYKAG